MWFMQSTSKVHYFLIIFSFVVVYSCGSKNEKEGTNAQQNQIDSTEIKKCTFDHCEINFKECIQKALYVLNDVDLTTYDSIASYYFEEVKDYIDEEAIVITQDLKATEVELSITASKHSAKIDSLQMRMKELKTNLLTYEKQRTGFIFIHTFLNKQDTLSAIVLINEDGTNSEAVLIKTVNDMDADMFAGDVKKLNDK
jgi:hypothetical protein